MVSQSARPPVRRSKSEAERGAPTKRSKSHEQIGLRSSLSGAKLPAVAKPDVASVQNVIVGVRVRAFREVEDGEEEAAATVTGNSCAVTIPKKGIQQYRFDCCFGPSTGAGGGGSVGAAAGQGCEEEEDESSDAPPVNRGGQRAVFEALGLPLIENARKGYNSSLLAYGATGSGKTYSMFNTLDSDTCIAQHSGIVPRVLAKLLEEGDSSGADQPQDIMLTAIEIYLEEAFDLLADRKKLRVRGDGSSSSGFFVEGSKTVPLRDLPHAFQLLSAINKAKSVATTALNTDSSRAHTILVAEVKTKADQGEGTAPAPGGTQGWRTSKIVFADLAGSERIRLAKTERGIKLEQAKNINLSLMALGTCVEAVVHNYIIGAPEKPVPQFRDSTLTKLLKDCIGGNSKTSMLVTVAPGTAHLQNTLHSLRFGTRAKDLPTNATANFEPIKEEKHGHWEGGKYVPPQRKPVMVLAAVKASLAVRLKILIQQVQREEARSRVQLHLEAKQDYVHITRSQLNQFFQVHTALVLAHSSGSFALPRIPQRKRGVSGGKPQPSSARKPAADDTKTALPPIKRKARSTSTSKQSKDDRAAKLQKILAPVSVSPVLTPRPPPQPPKRQPKKKKVVRRTAAEVHALIGVLEKNEVTARADCVRDEVLDRAVLMSKISKIRFGALKASGGGVSGGKADKKKALAPKPPAAKKAAEAPLQPKPPAKAKKTKTAGAGLQHGVSKETTETVDPVTGDKTIVTVTTKVVGGKTYRSTETIVEKATTKKEKKSSAPAAVKSKAPAEEPAPKHPTPPPGPPPKKQPAFSATAADAARGKEESSDEREGWSGTASKTPPIQQGEGSPKSWIPKAEEWKQEDEGGEPRKSPTDSRSRSPYSSRASSRISRSRSRSWSRTPPSQRSSRSWSSRSRTPSSRRSSYRSRTPTPLSRRSSYDSRRSSPSLSRKSSSRYSSLQSSPKAAGSPTVAAAKQPQANNEDDIVEELDVTVADVELPEASAPASDKPPAIPEAEPPLAALPSDSPPPPSPSSPPRAADPAAEKPESTQEEGVIVPENEEEAVEMNEAASKIQRVYRKKQEDSHAEAEQPAPTSDATPVIAATATAAADGTTPVIAVTQEKESPAPTNPPPEEEGIIVPQNEEEAREMNEAASKIQHVYRKKQEVAGGGDNRTTATEPAPESSAQATASKPESMQEEGIIVPENEEEAVEMNEAASKIQRVYRKKQEDSHAEAEQPAPTSDATPVIAATATAAADGTTPVIAVTQEKESPAPTNPPPEEEGIIVPQNEEEAREMNEAASKIQHVYRKKQETTTTLATDDTSTGAGTVPPSAAETGSSAVSSAVVNDTPAPPPPPQEAPPPPPPPAKPEEPKAEEKKSDGPAWLDDDW